MRQKAPQIVGPERDTSRRRRTIRPRQMQEHRAAAAGHPRAGIVVDLDDEIVDMIVPPQPVAWFSGRAAEGAIIAPVGGIFAPGDVTGNAPDGQQCPRPRMPVRPPPQADEPKTPARRGSIAFEFVGTDAPTAEHDGDGEGAGDQDAPRLVSRPCPHAKQGEPAALKRTRIHLRTGLYRPSASDSKFLLSWPGAHPGLQIQRPHWNHKLQYPCDAGIRIRGCREDGRTSSSGHQGGTRLLFYPLMLYFAQRRSGRRRSRGEE